VTDPEHADGRRERGRQTRASILAAAADVASVEGLEGLTIGRLATELGMSKSGLFAHFGAKEELQLATIAAARDVFVQRVIEPARGESRGLPRLRAIVHAWLAYLHAEVFAGGCFFSAVRAEFDSRPAGAVREAVAQDMADWLELLARQVRAAQEAGDLEPALDAEQLAFEIDAIGSATNLRFQLTGDERVFDRGAVAIESRLSAAAAASPRRPLGR
jgi:AcrR family transcriptional regulator